MNLLRIHRPSLFRVTALALSAHLITSSGAEEIVLKAGADGLADHLVEEAMLVQDARSDNFGGRSNFEVGVLDHGKVRTTVMRFHVEDPALGLFDAAGKPLFSSIDGITLRLTHTSTWLAPESMDVRVALASDNYGDWAEGSGATASDGGDADTVSYSHRRLPTSWTWPTDYTRGTGDGLLATVATWPGNGGVAEIPFAAPSGRSFTDIVTSWASGLNRGVFINDTNRSVFARWVFHSSESTSLTAWRRSRPAHAGSQRILVAFGTNGRGDGPFPPRSCRWHRTRGHAGGILVRSGELDDIFHPARVRRRQTEQWVRSLPDFLGRGAIRATPEILPGRVLTPRTLT